ncbi:hypothetical protein QO004_001876 [Rhizobium mesoamericanum]|nr:hypothetical protein [Rhizobium mesoamericanum]
MPKDENGWDFLVDGLGNEADLIARLSKASGQGSELTEAPSMYKRHVHRD